jgi:hypothetical protein
MAQVSERYQIGRARRGCQPTLGTALCASRGNATFENSREIPTRSVIGKQIA